MSRDHLLILDGSEGKESRGRRYYVGSRKHEQEESHELNEQISDGTLQLRHRWTPVIVKR